MFRPNTRCRIQLSAGNDVYGQPLPTTFVNEGCSVGKIFISNEKSSVRADSSASRGNAMELEAVAVILLTPQTRAGIDDIIEIVGRKLRILGVMPRFTVGGVLDHFEAHCGIWSLS